MTFNLTVFGLGVLGGALAELLNWWQLRESPSLPTYAKSAVYWIITVLMILAGGILAVLYNVDATNPMLALNIGISAPLILKAMAASVPSEDQRRALADADVQPSVVSFIAGR